MARDQLLELLAHSASEIVGVVGIDQRRKGIDRFAVEQDVQFGQLARTEPDAVVVERGVALGNALELVVEVEHDFRQGHLEIDLHAILRDEGLVFHDTPLVDAELEHVA